MKLKKFTTLIIVFFLAASFPIIADAEEHTATVIAGDYKASFYSASEAWRQAVQLGDSDEVSFILTADWKADDSGSFGSGTGFKDGGLVYSGGKNLTIDLNGYAIDRNLFTPKDNGAVFFVNSTLTVIDSKSDEYTVSKLFKGGAIRNGSNTSRGGGFVISDNATLNLNGGTVLNCVSTDDGGAISVIGKNAKLNVNGGSFYGNRTYDASGECCGGAIYSDEAALIINNSIFEGNYAEDNGGAIYCDDGKLNVSDSCFYSNSSIEEGGAVFTDGNVSTEIKNCVFSHNSSIEDDGGAIFCDSNNGTYLYDCEMFCNSSASEGGALHINADKVFILGGSYQYNTADEYGGGIYVDSLYDLNVAGKLIVENNTVKGKANDLCLQDGSSSTAYLYCGGFYEGSSVWLCSNDTGSQLAIKGIEKFQYNNYIHFDEGFALDKVNSSKLNSDNVRAVASVFGEGNFIYIILGTVIAVVIAFFAAVIIKKKKTEGKNNDQVKE